MCRSTPSDPSRTESCESIACSANVRHWAARLPSWIKGDSHVTHTHTHAVGRLRRFLAIGATAGLALSLTAPSASAIDHTTDWAKKSLPLSVKAKQGSTGYGYGVWRVTRTSDGTKGFATGTLKINNVDDHSVHYDLVVQANAGYCVSGLSLGVDFRGTGGSLGANFSCTKAFYDYKTGVSSKSYSKTWERPHYARAAVHPDGSVARGKARVVVAIPFAPDARTGWNFTGADTY